MTEIPNSQKILNYTVKYRLDLSDFLHHRDSRLSPLCYEIYKVNSCGWRWQCFLLAHQVCGTSLRLSAFDHVVFPCGWKALVPALVNNVCKASLQIPILRQPQPLFAK